MTFAAYCYQVGPHGCDLDVTLDPVAIMSVAAAVAVAALGFWVLIYSLSKKP